MDDTQIRTVQRRILRDTRVGDREIEHVCIDQPASMRTWFDNASLLAEEFGMSVLDVHGIMFTKFPKFFR